MATDLTKMVEDVSEKRLYTHMETTLFLAMVAKIEANAEPGDGEKGEPHAT